MGRVYTVPMKAVSVSAAQDLWSITSGVKALSIHAVTIGQRNLTAVELISMTFRLHTGTLTQGTGGSAPTPRPNSPNDTAATFTARMNDTGRFSSVTPFDLPCDAYNVLNGFFYLPAPEDRLIIAPSQAFVVGLENAPSAAMLASGSITVEELF